ncbi:hypothetical protein HOK51_08115 [Candidatus Woesearchaeota archaeon]|jgi:hypothetical protein|nr:hypothetical protein [Candidatus Woesearchaeota archaeon]MBT6519789.1 hypothetical protein [Candidatus Woesearchaeota archaeon]MBT7368168.1 hypothetical protein [Candidatus Woesearchaeota archaeon]
MVLLTKVESNKYGALFGLMNDELGESKTLIRNPVVLMRSGLASVVDDLVNEAEHDPHCFYQIGIAQTFKNENGIEMSVVPYVRYMKIENME